jgi:formylglycine-generating enzyme required for sulfatase activity
MDRLSRQFLSIPLEATLQPYSTKVREKVKEEQIAAEDALQQKWEEIKEILKPTKEKAGSSEQDQIEKTKNTPLGRSPNLRRYGIGAGILAVAALGILGVSYLIQSVGGNETPIPTFTSQLISTSTKTSESPTQPLLVPANTETLIPPTSTLTPTPTLGIGSTMISDKDDMTLLYVPEGEYTMGLDDDKYETDNPAHKIILSAFWIDQTEVTNGMYQKCVDAKVCESPYSVTSGAFKSYYGNSAFADFPVIHIPWKQAWNYCEWVERRLPTEAEWEKAARGATDERIYPWGDDEPSRDVANFGGLVGNTTSVYTQADGASPYGALNMAGNVWEWVADFYDPDYYHKSLSKDPQGPILTDKRVMRGGSWKDYPSVIRVVHRYADYPQSASNILGFRCADSPIK